MNSEYAIELFSVVSAIRYFSDTGGTSVSTIHNRWWSLELYEENTKTLKKKLDDMALKRLLC